MTLEEFKEHVEIASIDLSDKANITIDVMKGVLHVKYKKSIYGFYKDFQHTPLNCYKYYDAYSCIIRVDETPAIKGDIYYSGYIEPAKYIGEKISVLTDLPLRGVYCETKNLGNRYDSYFRFQVIVYIPELIDLSKK